MKLIKPTRVLCKRTCTSGKDHWWEDEGSVEAPEHPKRHPRENRMHVKGEWYDVIENENDTWDTKKGKFTFTILDKMEKPHLFFMYTEEHKEDFPDHCDLYGVRDYSKWFYTPEELLEVEAGTYKEDYKTEHAISVRLRNYHWVKYNDNWVIAQAVDKHTIHGKHYWNVMGTDTVMTDFNFQEIGEQVESMDRQKRNEKTIERLNELNETIFPMLDSWFGEGTEHEKWRAPMEYHKQFVKDATKRSSNKMWDEIADSPLFNDKPKKIEL